MIDGETIFILSLPAYSAANVETHMFNAPFAAAAAEPPKIGSSPMIPLVKVIEPFSVR